MANFNKTIQIPPASAETVIGKPIIKMVVLGNYPDVVEKANNLALEPPTEVDRWVLWFKQPNESELNVLFPNLPDDISSIVAFSLSTQNRVADTITTQEEADYVRIDQAYTKAGLPGFN
jgi:hypothetical protein